MLGPQRKKAIINPLSKLPPNQQYQSYNSNNSPNKATFLIRADCSDYVHSLSAKKDNYSTAFELHKACYENHLPHKCLKHLDFITLYCENEKKLLCVNCLYGSTAHKNHSVTPSNSTSSMIGIKNDNIANSEALEHEIQEITES
jgi:hypothetical protein